MTQVLGEGRLSEGMSSSEAEFSGEIEEAPCEEEMLDVDSEEAELGPSAIPQGVTKPFKCNLGPYGSNRKGKSRHISTHTKEKPFQCETCDYSCSRKVYLITHRRIHTREKPFQCSKCSFSSSWSNSLTMHTRTHTGEKPFKCKFCTTSLRSRTNLKHHIRIHTGEKPFQCKFCSHAFGQKGNLMTHMLTHTGEKPFRCEFCSHASRQKGNLMTHMLTHTGEKPFKCKFCSYACRQKGNLMEHMKAHTGKKPFKSKFCSYASSSQSNLVQHMKAHTGKRPYKCKVCSHTFATCSELRKHKATHSTTTFKQGPKTTQKMLAVPNSRITRASKAVQTSSRRLGLAGKEADTSFLDQSTVLVDVSSTGERALRDTPEDTAIQPETPIPSAEKPSTIPGSKSQAWFPTPPRRSSRSHRSQSIRSNASSSSLASSIPSTIPGSRSQSWFPTPPRRSNRSHRSQSVQSNASSTSSLRTNESSPPSTIGASGNQTEWNHLIPTPPRRCETTFVADDNLPTDNQILELKPTQATAPYPCPLCTTRAYSLFSYRRHARKHLFSRRFTCIEPNCEYSSPSFAPFRKHSERHHGTLPVLGEDSLATFEAASQRIQELI